MYLAIIDAYKFQQLIEQGLWDRLYLGENGDVAPSLPTLTAEGQVNRSPSAGNDKTTLK